MWTGRKKDGQIWLKLIVAFLHPLVVMCLKISASAKYKPPVTQLIASNFTD
jgi:hypothetical protein